MGARWAQLGTSAGHLAEVIHMDNVSVGSLDWLEAWQQVEADTVDLLADITRERWLELGRDDRSLEDWRLIVRREYSEDQLADWRCKVAAGGGYCHIY